MGTLIHGTYAFAALGLMIWAIWLWRTRGTAATLIMAFLAACIVYDNAIVAIGGQLGPGPLLEQLNWPRFYLGSLVPLMIIVALHIANAAGLRWTRKPGVKVAAWLLTGLLIAHGLSFRVINAEIQPACFLDTVRYVTRTWPSQFCYSDQIALPGPLPPWAAIISSQVALILGVIIMLRTGWPWLFIGYLLVPIASLSAPTTGFGMLIISGAWTLTMAMTIATATHFSRGDARESGHR